LDDIRTVYEVYIDFVQALSCIRLRAQSQNNIEMGIAGIKTKIQHARVDAAGLAPIYIVQPPSVGAMRSGLSAEFKHSEQPEKQPVIKRVLATGSSLTPEELVAWGVERQNIIKRNRDRFSGFMVKGLTELRALNSVMRMRVHLGNTQLLYYRKELKDGGYSYDKFASMMEESRTKATFEKM
jgi:hypothetical protein